jgi:hypothetical protein
MPMQKNLHCNLKKNFVHKYSVIQVMDCLLDAEKHASFLFFPKNF